MPTKPEWTTPDPAWVADPLAGSRQPTPAELANANAPAGLVLTNLADVTPQPIRWLWPGRIPCGKLTVIAGDPGEGKSLLTLDLAARVSTGAAWPDDPTHTPRPPGGVVLLSVEDDLADTVVPRLDAAGADRRMISAIEGQRLTEGAPVRAVTLEHLDRIGEAVDRTPDCQLIIADPVSAMLPGDQNQAGDVRAITTPLAALAQRLNLAVVIVAHVAKATGQSRAMYRVAGSGALIAAARVGWTVARDPQNRDVRVMLPLKANIAKDVGGMNFTIEGPDVPRVRWGERIDGTADDHAAALAGGQDDGELGECMTWLRDYLSMGARPSKAVQAEAQAAGFSIATLGRARKALRVQRAKQGWGDQGGWVMFLPGPAGGDGQPSPKDAQAPEP
ncbi:MAG: AAA family ATPase [Planctomycetaceae bacterium]|jgi:putative DNA primase/helicase|nr:AAA family ATPase [Phycisphaerales bacterium]MCE2653480.1 AAA family ATPase [Planctomycetaceae bacterium]